LAIELPAFDLFLFVKVLIAFLISETLVHSALEPCNDADFTFPVNFNLQEHTVFVRCRPYLRDFMERVSSLFEIIIFTASQSIYAEQLLNVLDPKRRIFRHRVFRESCVFVEGNYLKDLSVLGRDLARVIIIDNSPQVLLQNSYLSVLSDLPGTCPNLIGDTVTSSVFLVVAFFNNILGLWGGVVWGIGHYILSMAQN
jgi:Dullard-like phosphatase family protein